MLRSFKTEIELTNEQKRIFEKTVGCVRFVKNLYIERNEEVYKTEHRFLSAFDFSGWLNNTYIPENPDKLWLKDVSQKALQKGMQDTETAFKRFFKHLSRYPRFVRKSDRTKFYFVRNGKGKPIKASRVSIKVPTMGWVSIKEKGYIPLHGLKSGTIEKYAGKYFISVMADVNLPPTRNDVGSQTPGIGLDLGLKCPAMDSNGNSMPDIEKTSRLRFLEKKLKREHRRLSRMWEANVENKQYYESGKKKGQLKSFSYKRPLKECKNYQKQLEKIQKIELSLNNMRLNAQRQQVNEWVKAKPEFIAIEDLNVRGMLKNKHLAKPVSNRAFYRMRVLLTQKCAENGIELRIVNRWYPSSKTCHSCGSKNADLKLSDRVFVCPICGVKIDRDFNAAMNLRDTDNYIIVKKPGLINAQ